MADVLDVLIVGAGPTGLSLAVQLARTGARFRLVDALPRGHRESRALAVQARSLELLDTIDAAAPLVARGRRALRVQLHVEPVADTVIPLTHVSRDDTRFPFVLFVSQAETEAALTAWLESRGVAIERGVAVSDLTADEHGVRGLLTSRDGGTEWVAARYAVGCDGAHSTVRHAAGLAFDGDAYPHRFMLADAEISGDLSSDTVHAFPSRGGALLVLPLGAPRTWRLIAVDPRGPDASGEASSSPLALDELQAFVDRHADRPLRLHDPAWITRFRLHHRQAERYRQGRLFVAGDAAHIHSPAGGQGMNTGIQDAWNLGWKLGMVCRGALPEAWLDTYHEERWPVGRRLLRFTDRLFSVATRAVAGGRTAARLRNLSLRWLVPAAAATPRLRRRAFDVVSQLRIGYRDSSAVREGRPAMTTGPRAGDRLPDHPVTLDGHEMPLQRLVADATFHLLWCGAAPLPPALATLLDRRPVRAHHLFREPDTDAAARTALGFEPDHVSATGIYLVRPDGHVAYRGAGSALGDLAAYLDDWLPRSADAPRPPRADGRPARSPGLRSD